MDEGNFLNWRAMLKAHAISSGIVAWFILLTYSETGNETLIPISLFFLSTAILAAVLAAGLSQ